MNRFFDPDLFARTYRDPLAWLTLLVDLLPIIAVIFFGWKAVPLVALYWLENLVIGAFTIFRMLGTIAANALNIPIALFMVPFFTVHYGMFCFGHGIFLSAFAGGKVGDAAPGIDGMRTLVDWALGTGPYMLWFIGAIILVNAIFYLVDFIGRGDYRNTQLPVEMFAPYGRIVTLHVAIILGAGLMLAVGQPLLGVLILIILRVAFGMILNMLRRRKIEGGGSKLMNAVAEAG
ncbi:MULTISPECIES: DUF6498-containing protein [unclassified Hyphomonas]|jgi:hypothetical protein|uniref:DUF6498-containing protein n=1 Tax=unclassified Hyphomonas TaxID=2630699 RepID=UPI000458CCD5|nr:MULTISPECIES: DUF6498-containing protein [unclassified Hyphomonas]KCZ45240.1 hypothetical protein HY17_12510 [Hyphomonas sp. CY54-11-8]RAN42162.1 hypothetical protein HY26_00950 [Hyphomonas sp. GM-8P]